ncbi:MAG: hypothetical protein ACI90U_000807 [Pseudomonadales bacterium]|jgi:hypothetical protein
MSVISSSAAVFFTLCLVVFNTNASVDQPWHDQQYIADSFVKIALHQEYNTNAKLDMIRKWRQPIRAYVHSVIGNSELQKEMVAVQLNHLSSITGHRAGFVKGVKKANLIVIFMLKKDMKDSIKSLGLYDSGSDEVLKNSACIANIKADGKGEIVSAVIHIPVDSTRSSGVFLNCVVEEITQVMGLLNDSADVYPSIFNDQSTDSYLSGLDYVLLKLLYHPKIKPGMREDKVRAIVSEIFVELDDANLISDASTKVLSNSMRIWSGE